ncbi:tetratricopeptide repeat-containing sensor histidine kinase [Yeosuana sp. AK3]
MKKKLCYFLIFICSILHSQQKEIDSLEALLLNTKHHDSIRLNILLELGFKCYLTDPDRGIEALETAITIANTLNIPEKLAAAYQYKGHNYSTKGQDSLAINMYDKAISIYDEKGDNIRKARVIYNKGLIYFNQSNYRLANKSATDAYFVFKQANDSLLMAKMLNSIGLNYMYLSDYTTSLSKYFQALFIYEKLKDTTSLDYAGVNGSIGILYSRLEKYEKAIQYHEKALKIYINEEYQYGIANCFTNIGNAFDYLKNPKKAISHYEKAIKIMQNIDNQRGVASALTNIGIAYITLKDYKKALSYFSKSMPIYQRLNSLNNLAILYDHVGVCYLNLNNKGIAKMHFEKSLAYAKMSESLNLQVNALESLTNINYELGNYKQAYNVLNEAVILKDSFNSIEKKEELARLEEKYKYENEKTILKNNFQEERLIAKKEIEREKFIKRIVVFGSSSLFFLILVGMTFYRKKRESDFKAIVADTELKVLRTQMNPHFIFNTLSSISDYMNKNDIHSANQYLSKFSKLIRKTLESSIEKEVLLNDDIEILKNYLDIEKKRLNNSFEYSFIVDKNLDVNNVLIPPLILQPFLENSIWHGLSEKENGHIIIEFKKVNNMLFCSVDDNGVGRIQSRTDRKEHKSVGINLTKNRIDILNKKKNLQGNLQIIDKKEGVRVEVKLPLELAF